MWRLYVGGLLTGFAIGGAACWLIALFLVPESSRGNLLINPLFPWAILLCFVLAGETVRVKCQKSLDTRASRNSNHEARSDPGSHSPSGN